VVFFFFFCCSDDSRIPVSPVYGWPMAILPTNPSKQVAHAGHRIRALLGLLSFFACIVFVMVGRMRVFWCEFDAWPYARVGLCHYRHCVRHWRSALHRRRAERVAVALL
jgi:hypothetical protein